jgi:CheY-like chemotaxis protein
MVEKILVVEDNLQNMKVMVMSLRPHGYMLVQAMDGEEAINVAVKEKPDLIIMDMRLPKLDGSEVTKKLRTMPEFVKTPIIAVTAYAMKGDKERFLEAGCDSYLSKPVDTRQLPKVVAELLQSRKQA